MNLLYLTCLDSVINNAVYESQVISLVSELKKLSGGNLNITIHAIMPAVVIARKEIRFQFFKYNKELNTIKKNLKRLFVECKFIFLPFVVFNRYGSYLNKVLLFLFLVASFPILTHYIMKNKIQIIHCRSYLATLMAVFIKLFHPKISIVFDVRGFYPEEGVVHGCWKINSQTYKLWKKIEKILFSKSDHIIALSDQFRKHIIDIVPGAKCSLVLASVNTDKFKYDKNKRENIREKIGFNGSVAFVYSGGLGSWHDPKYLSKMFGEIKKRIPKSKFLILTSYNKINLVNIFKNDGLSKSDYLIFNLRQEEVPEYLISVDFGVVPLKNIKNDPAMQLIARTMIGLKVSEYLACGLPIIMNPDIKGLGSLMKKHKIGVYFYNKRLNETFKNIGKLIDNYSEAQNDCLYVAHKHFNLSSAAIQYVNIYSGLIK